MGIAARHFHDQLLERVTHLVKLFEEVLKECEGRTEVEIAQASDTFLSWAAAKRSKDKDQVLTLAWSKYRGLCCGLIYPSDKGFESFDSLPFNASPPWKREESALIAGLALATHARNLLQEISHDGCAVVAMLYADAVEANEFWNTTRGSTGCRLPHPGSVALHDRVAKKMLATQMAKESAKRRYAKDPKQAAKRKVKELWLERHAGKHPKLRTNEQFAAEAMRQNSVLTSAKNILGWCTDWEREAKSQPASR